MIGIVLIAVAATDITGVLLPDFLDGVRVVGGAATVFGFFRGEDWSLSLLLSSLGLEEGIMENISSECLEDNPKARRASSV